MESWQTARVRRRPVHIPDGLPSRTRALPSTRRANYSRFRSDRHGAHSESQPLPPPVDGARFHIDSQSCSEVREAGGGYLAGSGSCVRPISLKEAGFFNRFHGSPFLTRLAHLSSFLPPPRHWRADFAHDIRR